MPQASPRRFTGRHMTIILVTFFGVVMAVNFTMARLAIGTFGGTVVDNSYVASQNFNRWLAEARAQRALGWEVTVARNGSDHLIVTVVDATGAVLPEAEVTALARHPLGRRPERTMAFTAATQGHFTSTTALGDGRWQVIVTVAHAGRVMRVAHDIA